MNHQCVDEVSDIITYRAKVEPYNGIQGMSLLPILEGAHADIARDSMVIEDDQQRAVFGLPSGSRMRTLVTRRRRMTIAPDDPSGELYDLQNDPHEMNNLFEDAAHRDVRAELMEKLAYREMELADRSPLPVGRARIVALKGGMSASSSSAAADVIGLAYLHALRVACLKLPDGGLPKSPL